MDTTVGAHPFRTSQESASRHGDFVKIRRMRAARQVQIAGDTIRLGQLLKLAGIAQTGGESKALVAAGVLVNGERETRRGRQLRAGDIVQAAGEAVVIS